MVFLVVSFHFQSCLLSHHHLRVHVNYVFSYPILPYTLTIQSCLTLSYALIIAIRHSQIPVLLLDSTQDTIVYQKLIDCSQNVTTCSYLIVVPNIVHHQMLFHMGGQYPSEQFMRGIKACYYVASSASGQYAANSVF